MVSEIDDQESVASIFSANSTLFVESAQTAKSSKPSKSTNKDGIHL